VLEIHLALISADASVVTRGACVDAQKPVVRRRGTFAGKLAYRRG
jgi:hypothetical protein